MNSSSSKKRTFLIDSRKTDYVQSYIAWFSGFNLELFLTFLFGGIFLTIYLISNDVLLDELSKAILIITLLSLFRFIKPNTKNL